MGKLRENIDFYRDEKGLLIFTAAYLEHRGFCCHCGCRNCPYRRASALPTTALSPSDAHQPAST